MKSESQSQRSIRTSRLGIILTALSALLISGCMGHPDSLRPVKNFDIDRYLGRWYEIARLDHSFERGLSRVSAEYQMREDGGVAVINRGYSEEKKKWSEATGKAYFVNSADEAYLKVSFFGPFYGSYVIFELDQKDYDYAFVSGANTSYLWLLSRTPVVSDELKNRFIETAESRGFAVDDLIWVNQQP
jgi:apolipoprotein D and lipocalin family protein